MNIIPFESAKVPAALGKLFGTGAEDLVGNNASGGFPVISIKGKVFHIQRGDERILVTKPGEDDPASSLEVVIIKANPHRSKVFYKTGYAEGTTEKPDCYSNTGEAPEKDAKEPQAKKCAVCPHNQWGSKVTEQGAKGKACADSRRIAVATLDAPADPMLVRVPAASMKAMEDYGKQLAARGIPPQAVVTKIGFDYSVAHPALTFKPVGLIGDASLLAEIKKSAETELAAQIVGLMPSPMSQAESEADSDPSMDNLPVIGAPSAEPPVEPPAPAPAPRAAKPKTVPAEAAVDAAVSVAADTKKANVKVEAASADKLVQEVQGLLDNLDFDN